MSNDNAQNDPDNRPAVGAQVQRVVRRLSEAQLEVARRDAERPINVSLWAGWCDTRNGWCVYRNYENLLHADLLAGPFDTREEAEAVLGPELKTLWVPRGA